MDEVSRNRLLDNLPALVERIGDGLALAEVLADHGVFPRDMFDDVKRELKTNEKQGIFLLVEKVQKRGPNAYELFVQSLVETGHHDACRLLKPEWTEEKMLRMAHDWKLKRDQGLQRSHLSEPNFGRERKLSAPMPFKIQQLVNNIGRGPDTDAKPNGTPDQRQPSAPPASEASGNENARRFDPTSLVVKTANEYKGGEPHKAYDMTRNPRGYVLIINNEEFTPGLPSRPGSDLDRVALEHIFQQLHFIVITETNKTRADMKRILKAFADNPIHKNADACFVVIMSHGTSEKGTDYIYGVDHLQVEVEWILTQFNNENAKHLVEKPKVFLFQCCRGDVPDGGQTRPQEVAHRRWGSPDVETDGIPARRRSGLIATYTDMLMAFSTVPGFASFRQREQGTWFIQLLCEVIADHAYEMHFENLLRELDHRMDALESSIGEKQAVEKKTRAFKNKLYLNPGIYPGAPVQSDEPVTAGGDGVSEDVNMVSV